jgi:hypothetical protein
MATKMTFPKWALDAYKAWRFGGLTTAAALHKFAPKELLAKKDKGRSTFGSMLGKVCEANGTSFYAARAEGAGGGKPVAERTLIKHGVVTKEGKKARKRVKAEKEAVAAMTPVEEESIGEL